MVADYSTGKSLARKLEDLKWDILIKVSVLLRYLSVFLAILQ